MQTTPETPILEIPITGPIAWEAETLLADEGTVTLPGDCIAELMAAARLLGDNPLPIEALRPEDFELPCCTALMRGIRQTLDHGIGFAIVDRLPLDQVDAEIAPKLYWLLMSMVARPVAQKWDGTMVYAVTDTGVNSAPGNGVRASKTSEGQSYHTDNAFNLPPDFVSLFCLRPAREGGESGIVSFASVYNHLLADFAETIPRLYRPFFFDRQKEHAPGDRRVSSVPIMESDGEAVTVRLSQRLIPQGYAVEGVEMDDETRAAMAALAEVTERPALGRSFTFEPGQIQILNNRRIGHRRTAFTDWPEAGRKRHLVRIWMRKSGRAFYHG
jgi:hypothetical protein